VVRLLDAVVALERVMEGEEGAMEAEEDPTASLGA
jgi:hypothetical protein